MDNSPSGCGGISSTTVWPFLQTGQAKVNHYAYDLADWGELKKTCDHLWKNDVPIIFGPGRHGPGHNIFIYIPDPAG